MVAGFERYFQIARCLRDEDLRADRGFEHSQIDIEMSFVSQEDVMALDENMITTVVESMGYTLKEKPFPRITFKEAMAKYGADKFDLRSEEEKKNGVLAFVWVVGFPMFEKTKDDNWTFTHNPFSMPKEEDIPNLIEGKNIEDIGTRQYDLVCNGFEVGGGSIRSHRPEILKAVYKIMGYSDDEIEESIGHMLKAFTYGVPPHGGLAHGIDRLIMTLSGEEALREVVAFPQTSSGTASVTKAPTKVPDEQLKELGISVRSMQAKNTTSSVLSAIQSYLNQEGVAYKTSSHKPVFTSEEAAQARQAPLEEGAKALVLQADSKPIMVVISAANKLDLKAIKKLYGYKDVSMADKDTLLKVTGLEPGAIPPFGSLFKIPTYVDKNITTLESVSFNAGSHTKSIQMGAKDFVAIEKPTVGEFSK
jgi:Cys-tRNA(Pro) deacylase